MADGARLRLERGARPEAGYADPGEGKEVPVVAHRAGVLGDLQRSATIAAITYAVSGDWANFSGFGMGALLSWIGFAIAASGSVPSRDFRF
jgi:hypothetical protein